MCPMSCSCRKEAAPAKQVLGDGRARAGRTNDSRKERSRCRGQRRAYHDYFIDEKMEAGIMLDRVRGEIGAQRADEFARRVRSDRWNEAWLENVNISPYTQANLMNQSQCAHGSC